MPKAAILFFLLVIAAAFFGLTGIGGLAASIAWIMLIVFAGLFILSLLVSSIRGGGSRSIL